MGKRIVQIVVLGVLLCGLQGCAAVGLMLLATGVGVGAGSGAEYTMNGIAYRTFTAGLEEMHTATLTSLRRMDISVKTDDGTQEGRKLMGEAAGRAVEIELQRVTANTTRMRVVVKQGVFFKDRATAGEIITQTAQTLDEAPTVTQKRR